MYIICSHRLTKTLIRPILALTQIFNSFFSFSYNSLHHSKMNTRKLFKKFEFVESIQIEMKTPYILPFETGQQFELFYTYNKTSKNKDIAINVKYIALTLKHT